MEMLHTQEMEVVALGVQWWDQLLNVAMVGYSNAVACLNLRIQVGCMLKCKDKTRGVGRLHASAHRNAEM